MKEKPDITILIVEDTKFDEEATRGYLTRAGYRRIESVANAEDARALLAQQHFDIVILDLRLPLKKGTPEHQSHGVDLIDDIKVLGIPVVVFSQWATANCVAPVTARSVGYLRKPDIDNPLLLDSVIQATLSGGVVYSSTPLTMIQSLLDKTNKRADITQLSHRERQVVYLYAFKYHGGSESDKQVAEQLFIQPDTATKHRKNSMEKLGLHSSAELISWAHRNPNEFDQVREMFKDVVESE